MRVCAWGEPLGGFLAQTFVAGQSGLLTAVEIELALDGLGTTTSGLQAGLALVGDDGVPAKEAQAVVDVPLLTSQTASGEELHSVRIEFGKQAMPVQEGTRYAWGLIFQTCTDQGPVWAAGIENHPFAGGDLYILTNGEWQKDTGDLTFQTFVCAIP